MSGQKARKWKRWKIGRNELVLNINSTNSQNAYLIFNYLLNNVYYIRKLGSHKTYISIEMLVELIKDWEKIRSN